ncbi:MAG: PDC sensor domain-containing protein, partial [Stellaceae bacterium]
MRHIRAIPFARRIVLLTILFLVAVYAGNAVILGHYYGVLAERERDARDARAALLAEHAGRALAAVDLSLRSIADGLKARLPLDKPTIFTQLLLDKYIKALPEVHGIFVLDADGHDINSSSSFPPPALNASDRMYFSEQKKWLGTGLYLDRLQVSRVDHRVVFTVSRPILDNNGNFEGVVAAVIDPAYFSDFYGRRGGQQGNVVLLERDDGAILAGTGLSDQDLAEGDLKSLSKHAKAYSTHAKVHGFPARIVVIGNPTITSPQFLGFCAMDAGLLLVMTIIAWWLANAAA